MNMDKTITIQIRNVYGKLKAYPVCNRAEAFARIAGSKTLTLSTLCEIRNMGYDIKQESSIVLGHWTAID